MATMAPLEFETLLVGSAGDFRRKINDNFAKIKTYFETFDAGTEIIVSATQPEGQKPGSFWYKVL